MKLSEIQQQAIQARMALTAGAQNFDRLFAGTVFDEIIENTLFVFARTEALAGEIEERFAVHLPIVAGQITGLPVEFVEVLPKELMQPENE